MGAFFHVAAEAIGISSSTLKLWMKNARIDIAGERDSLYSRLYADIRRATAQARCGVEVAYAALNPAKWLAKGPGSVFGSHWSEPVYGAGGKLLSDSDVQSPTINSIDSALDDPLDVEEIQDTTTIVPQIGMTVMVLSPEEELATLEAQESAGHIQVSEEYKNSLRKQIQR